MQRVVYFQPANREVLIGAEVLVAKHLVRDVAKLDKQAQLSSELDRQSPQQFAKHSFGIYVGGIFALAIHSALCKEVQRQQPVPTTYRGQDVAHHTAVGIPGYGHVGLLPRSALYHSEELGTVKKVVACYGRQVLALRDNRCTYLIHNANIRKR